MISLAALQCRHIHNGRTQSERYGRRRLSGGAPPGPAEYFVLGNRSISRDELLRLLDFEKACSDAPDHDVIAVLETVDGRSRAYLVALPRNHPSRFDASGRRDPSRAPFWRHGEVMHIKKQSQPP